MKYLSVVSMVVSVITAVFCYQLWQQSSVVATQMQSLEAKNEQLIAELKASQDELGFIRAKLLEYERKSLKGIADKANDAFLDGWESLIGIVGKEIDQARKNLDQQREKESEPEEGDRADGQNKSNET